MSLAIIPLAVFLCLVILIGILGFEPDALMMFLLPYAVAIVPLTALILFKPYTKKGDSSYLLSIPLTRTQIFLTNYLVGLTLILLTLVIMTPISLVGNDFIDIIRAMWMFISLGVIYFTFACLGCMMAGQTITQFLIMGVICFGPIALYLLNKVSVAAITLGGYSTPFNDSFVMIICPLVSAMEFISGYPTYRWPYWWAHILIVIACLGLCLYLIKRRPVEQTETGTLFENVDRLVVKPVVYLNLVFVIFNICLYLVLNQTHQYDVSYYLSVLALLLGSSLLVNFLLAIWTSKNLKSLFNFKELIYQVSLVLLSCIFLLVPLWQNEQARFDLLDREDNTVRVALPFTYYHSYKASLDKEKLASLLEEILEDRSKLTSYNYDQNTGYICINYDQYYYFDTEDLSESLNNFIQVILLESRDDYLGMLANKEALIQTEQGVYLQSSIRQAIFATYKYEMNDSFISRMSHIDELEMQLMNQGGHLYDLSNYILEFYPLSFTDLDYISWVKAVDENLTADFSKSEWKEITDVATDFSKGTITSKHLKPVLEIIEIEKIYDSSSWYIYEADEDYLNIRFNILANILDDYNTDEMTLFKDTQTEFTVEVHLNKVNGQWIPTFEGVYY